MKHILTFVITITHSLISIGQLTNFNFLVGCKRRITSQKETLYSKSSKSLNIKSTPEIGYFLFDKIAGGNRSP